jgi:cell division protease FtsH
VKDKSGLGIWLIIFTVFIAILVVAPEGGVKSSQTKGLTYKDIITEYKKGDEGLIEELTVVTEKESRSGVVKVKIKADEKIQEIVLPDTSNFLNELNKYDGEDIKVNTKLAENYDWVINLIPTLLGIGLLIFVFSFFMSSSQGGSGGGKVMNFGKSKARLIDKDKNKIKFKDVAGLDEEKEEVTEIVEFLKTPKKFMDLGARIPKGFLLVGPPGTGKTLLAKAVAGEAEVPFFTISGSDFVEMFVGVGASRVRDLFTQAKKNAPSVIFIDEIDAVGRKRGAGLGGGHDEREQTLNQMLVEMDGFAENEGVIVLAATNRPDILDQALLRPGRFDRQIVVGRPDIKGREAILKVHAEGKPFEDEVDLSEIAKMTSGFTGADLENLLNESAIEAARADRKKIIMNDVREAFIKVGIGKEKKSRVISDKEKKVTAYHEAGHAILHEVLSEMDPVHSVSIIPTGLAGGYTMHIPEEDRLYVTKTEMEQEIVTLLGGRAAEKIIFDDITTGASNDIQRATSIARNMVSKYGMSDKLGPIQFGSDNDEVFLGRDYGHTRVYGEEVAATIDNEIKNIVETAYKKAIDLLKENMDMLHKMSETLLDKEKITGDEIEAMFIDLYGKAPKIRKVIEADTVIDEE